MPYRLEFSEKNFELDFKRLLNRERDSIIDVEAVVKEIIEDIRTEGDQALIEHTARLDNFKLTAEKLLISKQEIRNSFKQCSTAQIEALQLAAERIKSFHIKQLPQDIDYEDQDGVRLGLTWKPIESVGMYVPGGVASYPSSVLMNAIPAKIAGVKRLVMAVPTRNGEVNQLVLAAANIAGVDEIYRVGGAQAIAALAFGTDSICPVDKIIGPGNLYVSEAKRQVYGFVGIDMLAGPSEILVVADGSNNPSWIAADLLSQAEHDVSAQAILITNNREFADRVSGEIDVYLSKLPRAEIAKESWEKFGAIIVVQDIEQSIELINRLAPEHLELAIENPKLFADKISHVGSIFLGRNTPEALGDYVGGPNHVLPTARSARYSSGLGLLDFMKRTTFLGASEKSIKSIGPAAVTLAEAEGLDIHGLSVKLRLVNTCDT